MTLKCQPKGQGLAGTILLSLSSMLKWAGIYFFILGILFFFSEVQSLTPPLHHCSHQALALHFPCATLQRTTMSCR